jgi:hypothetical protein
MHVSTVEMEMGLLTMAFLAGEQDGSTPISLGNLPLEVFARTGIALLPMTRMTVQYCHAGANAFAAMP